MSEELEKIDVTEENTESQEFVEKTEEKEIPTEEKEELRNEKAPFDFGKLLKTLFARLEDLKKSINYKELVKKLPTVALGSLICLLFAFFAVYGIISATEFEKNIFAFTEKSAYIDFDSDIEGAERLAGEHFARLDAIAKKLEFAENAAEVSAVLQGEYRNVTYFSRGVSYDAHGERVEDTAAGYAEITALAEGGVRATTDLYYSTLDRIYYISFYIPVRGSLFVDGISSAIEAENIIDISSLRNENEAMTVLIDRNGETAAESYSEGFAHTAGANIKELIISMAHDDELPVIMNEAINSGRRLTYTLKTDKTDYTLSLAPVNNFGGHLLLLSLTENSELTVPELNYVRGLVALAVVAAIAMVSVIIYATLRIKKLSAHPDIKPAAPDTPDGCPGKELLRINATKLLSVRERKYALAVFEIRQFRYIGENISEKDMSDLLSYIAKVVGALCDVRESYGYLGDGKFALLIHIESDRTVKDRVRLVESIAGKNAFFGQGKSKRKFNIGISMTRQEARSTFTELLGYAEIACEKAKNNINVPYVIFNEQINTERIHNEKIEAEMENALANGEFRLFLQPKYNIAADRIDSAEALVRWFDTEKGDYRFPGEFIGLFESNGFITKLDHFMYIETLKYLSSAAEKFDKIVPISVNVSMITVSDPAFLDFYVENKKKYRVGDNFIVIEFTESFAMEDYQKIRRIVDTLHEKGIRCSLDDFGSGYSSLGTLKNIPFDEIKFDRLFLARGYNKRNDDAMLETMFSLARDMGIKVVQEGVETKEMFDSITAKGCDVIQGYYYAKAIPLEEYKLFINSNTSIKYKSRVK